MQKIYYEVYYPSEAFHTTSRMLSLNEIRVVTDTFVREYRTSDSAVHIWRTDLDELGEEQGHPGGPRLSFDLWVTTDNEEIAYKEALELLNAFNALRAFAFGTDPGSYHAELHRVRSRTRSSVSA